MRCVQPSVHLKSPQPAALADHAGLREFEQARYGMVGQPPFLVGEVVDEFCSVGVVLAYVVVVDCLLEQPVVTDLRVDRRGCSVGSAEKRLTVDLADESSVDLNGRVGPDHLQGARLRPA